MYYPQWRRINKPIDRHHVLLDSLVKLVEGKLFCIINLFQTVGYGFHSSLVLQQLTNPTHHKGMSVQSVQSVSPFDVQSLLGYCPFRTLLFPWTPENNMSWVISLNQLSGINSTKILLYACHAFASWSFSAWL
jgi:hypothetical protein